MTNPLDDGKSTYHIECARTGGRTTWRDVRAATREDAVRHVIDDIKEHGPHGWWRIDNLNVDARKLRTYPIKFREVGGTTEVRQVEGVNLEDARQRAIQELWNHGPRGSAWTVDGRPVDPGRHRW